MCVDVVLILRMILIQWLCLFVVLFMWSINSPACCHQHDVHSFCLATVFYNIVVVVAEVVLQIFLVAHNTNDAVSFEIGVQIFHFIWVILLAFAQRLIIHKLKKQNVTNFFGISVGMLAVHMFLLHIVPRILWFVMEHERGGTWETSEFIMLMSIILFVTILFWKREKWLHKRWLKNKRVWKLPL